MLIKNRPKEASGERTIVCLTQHGLTVFFSHTSITHRARKAKGAGTAEGAG